MRTEGFSCSLGVLYIGLGISRLQFLILKKKICFTLNFFKFLVIKALDQELDPDPHPDPQLEKMLDPQPCLEVGFGEEVAMAAGAAVGPEVVVGAGVRVQAASGTEHLEGPKKIYI